MSSEDTSGTGRLAFFFFSGSVSRLFLSHGPSVLLPSLNIKDTASLFPFLKVPTLTSVHFSCSFLSRAPFLVGSKATSSSSLAISPLRSANT